MTALTLKRVPLAFRLSARAATLTGVYLAAALAVLGTVFALRALVAPATLDRFLGFVLIASVAAGLEPATVRAAALGEAGVEGASPVAYVVAGALKGVAASLVLALAWRFADPGVPAAVLAWTPALAVAGFCATDLRAALDLRGRYAMAIAVKQGSLGGGVALAGLLVATSAPLTAAIGAACLARVAVLGLAVRRLGSPGREGPIGGATVGGQVRRLLADRRWIDMAAVSVLAAAGGGADRLFGLRYLNPVAYGGYYLTSELFSKFWLLPYLLAPILFARRAGGRAVGVEDGFGRAAWGLVALAGAAYLAATTGLVVLAPALLRRVAGAAFGPATLAFVAAVVLNSFSQLRVAELQGAGRPRRAALAVAFGAAVSVPLFFVAARGFGAGGLLLAWLAKSILELAVLMPGRGPSRKRGDAAPASAP